LLLKTRRAAREAHRTMFVGYVNCPENFNPRGSCGPQRVSRFETRAFFMTGVVSDPEEKTP